MVNVFSTTGLLGLCVRETVFTGYMLIMPLHCVVEKMLNITGENVNIV